MRYYLEKNDYINGFQFIVDQTSGWSSVGLNLKHYVMEECPKSSNIFMPVSYIQNPISQEPIQIAYSYSNAIHCLAEWTTDCDCVLPMNLYFSLQAALDFKKSPLLYKTPRIDARQVFINDTESAFFLAGSALYNMSSYWRGKNSKYGSMRNYFEELAPMPSTNMFSGQYLVRLWDSEPEAEDIEYYSQNNIYKLFYNEDCIQPEDQEIGCKLIGLIDDNTYKYERKLYDKNGELIKINYNEDNEDYNINNDWHVTCKSISECYNLATCYEELENLPALKTKIIKGKKDDALKFKRKT